METSVQQANKALVQRLFYDGFSGGDLEVVESIFSPDIKLVDPNLPPGIEGIKAIVKKNNDTFEGWAFEIHDLIAVNDKVVARWTGSGIHTKSFMRETPTNKRVELNGLSIYQIANGRIVTDWVIPDNLQFLMQLGILSPQRMADEAAPVGNN
jgi:predicted ester cyclase